MAYSKCTCECTCGAGEYIPPKCSRCKGEVPENHDVVHISKHWGYFSCRDNDFTSLLLCETCYNDLLAPYHESE